MLRFSPISFYSVLTFWEYVKLVKKYQINFGYNPVQISEDGKSDAPNLERGKFKHWIGNWDLRVKLVEIYRKTTTTNRGQLWWEKIVWKIEANTILVISLNRSFWHIWIGRVQWQPGSIWPVTEFVSFFDKKNSAVTKFLKEMFIWISSAWSSFFFFGCIGCKLS